MSKAVEKLIAAQKRTKSLLSIGLEPSPEYLPKGFAPNLQGYEEFLKLLIEATEDLAPAYKINIAFFESLGWEGVEFLYAIREAVPEHSFLIIDAKRGDIGSTAKHYAKSLFEELRADAVTLNPLMGRDSAEPFLAYEDRLSYFLGLTSNPGAEDFLLQDDLYLKIATKVSQWNTAGNCGLVTGATWPERLAAIREKAPTAPLLIPGVGAQGGSIGRTMKATATTIGADAPVLIHVTRGILPSPNTTDDPAEIIRKKTQQFRSDINAAIPKS